MPTPPLHDPNSSNITTLLAAYNLSPTDLTLLSTSSTTAKSTAYCPYSNFRVGAALLLKDDSIITGANVENASYPVGTCAERVALGIAVVHRGVDSEGKVVEDGQDKGKGGSGNQGWDMGRIRALGVASDISPPASPCGMCRQFIREFCALDMPILMFDKEGMFWICRLEELLPLSFGPEALPPPAKSD